MNPTTLETPTERGTLPSASQDWRWLCGGSSNLWETLGHPEQAQEDEWASRGTILHKAFETGNTFDLDDEMLETYDQGLKFLDQLLARWQQERGLSLITEGPRETRFWIRAYDLSPLASAQLDRHWLAGGDGLYTEAAIVDFKSGFVPNLAPSAKSTQLRLQLVALVEEHPQVQHVFVAYDKAKLKMGADDWTIYGPEDIAYAQQWVRLWLWQTRQPDAPRTPGKHCGYCPCKGSCVEGGSYSLLPSVIAQRALAGAAEFDPVQAVSVLAPADLLKIWSASGVIKKVMDAVQDRLKAMPDEQLSTLGLGRGKPRETRTIANVSTFVERCRGMGWTDAEIFACLKVSNEPVEKEMRRQKSLSSDRAAKEAVAKEFADLIETNVADAPIKAR